MPAGESRTAIFAAIGGNLAVAITKFAAAAITGSSAMLAEGIRRIAERQPGIVQVQDPLTMYFGPDSMLVNLAVEFHSSMPAEQVAASIDAMEDGMRAEFPEITHVFIAAETFRRQYEHEVGGDLRPPREFR